MALCPAGHDSADPRHCDHCGQPIGARSGATARTPPAPVAEWQCPVCGRGQTRRFCEFDGHDSQRAPAPADSPRASAPRDSPPAATQTPAAAPGPAVVAGSPPVASGRAVVASLSPVLPGPPVAAGSLPLVAGPPPVAVVPEPAVVPVQWHAVATADRAYFDFVRDTGGAEVATLTFPTYYPIRRFPLRGTSMLVGRYSVHRGIDPEIDLGGTHEDPAVGRAHAQLVSRPGGCWAVVDLESTNHTYLNDFTADPIGPNAVIDLRDGDRIYLGAWTRLTVHARPLSPDGAR